jgi:hypothetical protein
MMRYAYHNLSDELKSLATQMWVAEGMSYFNTKKCSEFIAYLEEKDNARYPLALEIGSRFWYKKLAGQIVKRLSKIQRLDSYINNASHVLNHPVFQLLDLSTGDKGYYSLLNGLSEQCINELTAHSKRQVLRLHSNKRRYTLYCTIRKLSRGHSLDDLTVLLLIYANNKYEVLQKDVELLAFTCFCNLFSTKYPEVCARPMCQSIAHFIKHHKVQHENEGEYPRDKKLNYSPSNPNSFQKLMAHNHLEEVMRFYHQPNSNISYSF